MADIFISYASEDRPSTRWLAEALEACGWSVWWDDRGLRGGQDFERVIEEEIAAARVVIVVWSQNSIDSEWVRAEAAQGLREKKLVPVRIDMADPPLRYRTIHTIDLSSWVGESEAEPFERLLETLSHYLGPSKKAEQLPKRKPVKAYVLAILATTGLLLGVVRLVFPPDELPIEATVFKSPRSAGDVVAAIDAAYERGDYKTVFRLALPAAEQGDAFGQFNLGRLYHYGRVLPQDDAKAVRWYRKAAEQGHADAQLSLGEMYYYGRGLTQDKTEAVRWYRKAAEQGHADAQANLGSMYEMGRVVPQDDAKAVQWYRKAAAQGNTYAQKKLALLSLKERR